jgi:serine/threonine-protein kinase
MQLQGAGLEAEVGNLVEITGTVDSAAPTVAGASQIIDVTSVKRLTKRAAAAGAAGAGAAGAGAAGAGAAGAGAGGLSTGAIVAIVGGVAAAGTLGGLAAEHDLPGQGSSQPSTSR